MGKHAIRLLKFLLTYDGWHSYGRDATTVRAVKRLLELDLIETNECRQMRIKRTRPELTSPGETDER